MASSTLENGNLGTDATLGPTVLQIKQSRSYQISGRDEREQGVWEISESKTPFRM
jgi:hypothetical protein